MIQDTTALYDNVIAILSYFAYEIILFFRNITLSLQSVLCSVWIFHLVAIDCNDSLCALHKYKIHTSFTS